MKPLLTVGVVASVFAASLGLSVLRAEQHSESRGDDESRFKSDSHDSRDDDDARIRIGLAYARNQHIPLDLTRRNRDVVGLGSYLVNAAGGCNDCHSAPPYLQDPYAFLGAPKQINVPCYLAGGQEFGPFVSRDITPWEDGKPAGLTFAGFRHVIRTGEDPDNPGQLLQVMPWPVYQSLSDSDLRAIYEYLSAIPPIPANVCGVPSE